MVKSSDAEQGTKNPSLDAAKSPRGESGQLAAIRRFREVGQAYAQASAEATSAAQRRWESAQQRYAEAQLALQKDTQSKLEQAYKTGADAWDASRSDDASVQYEGLNRQYLAATSSILEDARTRFADSLRTLSQDYEDAASELDTAVRSAYREYLRSLQDAWRAVDVDAIADACTLAQTIGLRV